jgi:hypothetical protein
MEALFSQRENMVSTVAGNDDFSDQVAEPPKIAKPPDFPALRRGQADKGRER